MKKKIIVGGVLAGVLALGAAAWGANKLSDSNAADDITIVKAATVEEEQLDEVTTSITKIEDTTKTEKGDKKEAKKVEAKHEVKKEDKKTEAKQEVKKEAKPLVDAQNNKSEDEANSETNNNSSSSVQKTYNNYKEAYLDIINQYKVDMSEYIFQYDCDNMTEDGQPIKSFLPLALTDVTGDGNPELLMLFCLAPETDAMLSIYSYGEDKTVSIIYNGVWHELVAGGTDYALFKKEGSDTLYAFKKNRAQIYDATYYELVPADNGSYDFVEVAKLHKNTDEASGEASMYYVAGNETTALEFMDTQTEILSNISELVLFNHLEFFGEEIEQKLLFETTASYGTVEDTIAKLQ